MNTEDSEFQRLEHEALLRASQHEQLNQTRDFSDDDCRDIYNAAMYLPNRSIVSVMRYIIAHTVAQPVRPRLDQSPDYERGFVDGMQFQTGA